MKVPNKIVVVILFTFLLVMINLPIIGTMAIGPQAKLIGVQNDYGFDVDNNGAFDYLVVSIEINVSEAAYYRVQVSGLKDAYGNYISVSGSSNYSSYFGSGSQVLDVYLDGQIIHESGYNPSSVDSITLYGGLQPWDNVYFDSLYNVPLKHSYLYTQFESAAVVLTGTVKDRGVDTDGDGLFNYLEIDVEVNVTKAGYFSVSVSGLQDSSWNYINIWNTTNGYLSNGISFLNVSLNGFTIRGSHMNATYVNSVSLSASCPDYLYNIPLSRVYSYTEFDAPAFFTGIILDKGVDTDSDGKYNFLEIDVQLDVSEPGNYEAHIHGLLDSSDYNSSVIDVDAQTSLTLQAGLQFANLTLDGTRIYRSNRNPLYVSQIYIRFSTNYSYDLYHDSLMRVPLSRQYHYGEFDPPRAMLTGKIYDSGIDNDYDGKFNFLEVGVELNVTDPGTYYVGVNGLDADSGDPRWPYTIYVSDYKKVSLNPGVQTIDLYLYGPQIYASHNNPASVSYVYLNDGMELYQSLYDIPLSRVYDHTEFDSPFTDVETKFVVFPDGRVVLEGSLRYTDMLPKNTGPAAIGSFNLTANNVGAQAQAGLSLTFPQQLASEFPFNSTMANLLAMYQNGLLNVGINSSMTLPPGDNRYQPYGQWPFNATDGTVTMTYSGGVINLDINGNTTLPPTVTNQLPFNATDLTLAGTYTGGTLNGRITFSILREIPFDDVNVDFTGNGTDLTLNGTLTVVFGVSLGSLVIHNQTELQHLIDELKSTIPGENGLLWNATGGNLNVTALEIDTTPLPSWNAAKVTFMLEVKGDFIEGLAYLISQGRNPELVHSALDEAYKSAETASFLIDYTHDTRKAAVKLTFSFDLKRFVDNAISPAPGTLTYVLASDSMYPALSRGDVVFVETVENFSDIVADSKNGDIIAFYRPDLSQYYYPEVIISRVVGKSFENGTWYFETRGDSYWSSDQWRVPQSLVIGKVVRRVPFLGFLLYPSASSLFGYYWYYQNMAVPLRLGTTAFDSVQEASVALSYSSSTRRFDVKLTLTDKLEWLKDNITQSLSEYMEYLLPQIPTETKEFYEKLLNTTYASVDSAQISASYANGIADFKATVNIEGDLNKEINYVKDLYFSLLRASYGGYNVTIPWQLDFIDKTQLDLSNLRVSARLTETSFEGSIKEVTITPPRDVINATDFRLTQLFNLTAPQNPWQTEFPGRDQRLRITVEGGSNATNTVTLFKPETVPAPDEVAPYNKSITWFNQTISSLKGLIFKIGPRLAGNLTVITTPVSGEVFVNGISWGLAPSQTGISRIVDVGTYEVSFGSVAGYYSPASQSLTMSKNAEITVTGVYIRINGTLAVTTSPLQGEIFVNGVSWGTSPQSRIVQIGTYTVSFGAIENFDTPANQVVMVTENATATVTGTYAPTQGTTFAKIEAPDIVDDSNPFIIDAIDDASVHLTITGISDPVFIIIRNVTASEYAAPPGTWKLLGNCIQITVNNTGAAVNATIRIYYTLDQLKALGIDESSLKIHYWNATSSQWIAVESHVNTTEHYVWAIVDHFSIWAIMGQATPTTPLWLYVVVIAAASIAIMAVAAVYVRRRKPTTATMKKE